MKLNALKFGLAAGIFCGLNLFILTLVSIGFGGYAAQWLNQLTSIYPGYEISLWGSFIGLAWGFINGFLSAGIFAWIYNHLSGS